MKSYEQMLSDTIKVLKELNDQCTDPHCSCPTGLGLYQVAHNLENWLIDKREEPTGIEKNDAAIDGEGV